MSDHVVLSVDRIEECGVPSGHRGATGVNLFVETSGPSCSPAAYEDNTDEEFPLIQMAECRICQDEDYINNMETPCNCNGSLKYAHRKCIQQWCNEKGDITCEICHRDYQPDYTAPPTPPHAEDIAVDIGGGWTISGTPLDLRDPRLLAFAEAERHYMEAEYNDYAATNSSGSVFCRSAALIIMALLLLRNALTITDADGGDEDDESSAFFSIFLLRAAVFLLPCYVMAWAICILQRRRQREMAAAMAAIQVAFVLRAGQHRGLQFAIASAPVVTPHQEPV